MQTVQRYKYCSIVFKVHNLFYHSVLFCNDIVDLKSYLLNIENKNLTKSSIATQ